MNAEREVLKTAPISANAHSLDAFQNKADRVDALQTLWRWKWLVLLGLLLGLTVGYLIVIQLPPQYSSFALVQILTPSQKTKNDSELDLGETALMETRQDEIRIMRGLRVINNAIATENLDQHPQFAGKSLPDIIEWITDEDRLLIAPGTKEAKTDLIEMEFICDDRELAGEVLGAILKGYQMYLEEAYRGRGEEVFQKLAEYRDQYDSRYRVVKDQYIKRISTGTNLLWQGDELRNPHALALEEITKKITELTTEADHIDAVLKQVEEAKAAGRPAEGLIVMLEKEIGSLDQTRVETTLEAIEKVKFLEGENNQQLSMIKNQILEREIEREKLLGMFGDKHRTIKSIDLEIGKLREQLEDSIASSAESKARLEEDLMKRYNGAQTPEERLSVALASAQETRQSIETELRMLALRAAEQRSLSMELQAQLAEVQILENEMELFEENATELKKTLQSLQVGADYNRKKMEIHNAPGIGIQTGPSYLKFLGVGGLLGGAMFFGLAYLLEMADRSFRSPDEIMKSLGVPVLGHIPIFEVDRRELRDDAVDASVVTLHKPQSNTSECYRGIRTSLFFANKKDSTRYSSYQPFAG